MWDFYVCISYLLVIFSMLSEHPLLLNLLLQALHNISFCGLVPAEAVKLVVDNSRLRFV